MRLKKLFFLIIGILILAIIVWVVIVSSVSSGTCGGIGGWKCPKGYFCRMSGPDYPDKAGNCLPDRFPFYLLKR